MGTFRLF
jgi:hypothetical protein